MLYDETLVLRVELETVFETALSNKHEPWAHKHLLSLEWGLGDLPIRHLSQINQIPLP